MAHPVALVVAIVFCAAVLVAYSRLEMRINRRACPECGLKVSLDAPGGDCPRCAPVFDSELQQPEQDDPFSSQRLSHRVFRNWPRLVFALGLVVIIIVAGGLLAAEHFQSDADKAIRLVRESNSRKENFTVQQYLYATVYHRRDQGEPIAIGGWRAESSEPGQPIRVEFSYSDAEWKRVAVWEASLEEGRVTPRNEIASDISWR
ncbi:MAG: hypothetical protein AABO41_01320 [Acidobacteriota bacterium]